MEASGSEFKPEDSQDVSDRQVSLLDLIVF